MGIGASIFMLAVGAIIAFAVNVHVGWLDLSIVGWVLMLAGAVGLIMTFTVFNSRRRTVVTSTPTQPVYPAAQPAPYPGERRVVEEQPAPYDRPL